MSRVLISDDPQLGQHAAAVDVIVRAVRQLDVVPVAAIGLLQAQDALFQCASPPPPWHFYRSQLSNSAFSNFPGLFLL
jgi:hypothetical protein